MGLFSFIKNAGEKLFDKKDEAEKKDTTIFENQRGNLIESYINKLDLNIQDLNVKVNEDRATVTGKADTMDAKEKAIIAIGNVSGIAAVEDRITVDKTQAESRMYTVESGDTLSKISKEFYGDAQKYNVIFEANKPMLKDPDKIYPGQVLRIPAQS